MTFNFLVKDWADGKFARIKDKLFEYLHHHSIEEDGYKEVLDSLSFSEFGANSLCQPGPRSGIERRTFNDLSSETIKERRDEVIFQLKSYQIDIFFYLGIRCSDSPWY